MRETVYHPGRYRPGRALQLAECLARRLAGQPSLQSATALPARLQLRGPLVPVHSAPRRAAQPAPRPGVSCGARDQPRHALLSEPPLPGQCAHCDSGRNRRREESLERPNRRTQEMEPHSLASALLTQQLQGHDRREMLLKKVAPGEVIALHGVGSILETATEVPAGQEK